MDGTRIRWKNVGRLVAGLGTGGLLIAVVPGLLEPPEPPPIPADVGLTQGATGFAGALGETRAPSIDRGPRGSAREARPRPDPRPEPPGRAERRAAGERDRGGERHAADGPARPRRAPPAAPAPAPPVAAATPPPPSPPAADPPPSPEPADQPEGGGGDDHPPPHAGSSPSAPPPDPAPSQFGFEH